MPDNKIFIITGKQGEGKTTLLSDVVLLLKEKLLPVSGFIAKGYWKNGQRTAFDLVDVQSGKTMLLCYRNENGYGFTFRKEALQYGKKLLDTDAHGKSTLFIVDEVGKMELKEDVWFCAINKIITTGNNPLLITVRKKFIEEVIKKFAFKEVKILSHSFSPEKIMEEIISIHPL